MLFGALELFKLGASIYVGAFENINSTTPGNGFWTWKVGLNLFYITMLELCFICFGRWAAGRAY